MDLGRDTRISTLSRRLVRRKDASWSLNWPSGANSLAHTQLKCIYFCLCDFFVLVFLCFGRVLTRLDSTAGAAGGVLQEHLHDSTLGELLVARREYGLSWQQV